MPANRYYEGKTDDELVNEIIGGLRYIAERYGTPERAFRFWQEHHWYDRGGVAGLDGPELALLGERGPELVLDADTTRALARMGVVQLRRGPLELSAPDLAAVGGGTRRSSDAHGGAGTVVHQHLSVSATFLPTQRTRRQEEDMVRALIRDELRRARFGV
jgi:SLT domain-containing protein